MEMKKLGRLILYIYNIFRWKPKFGLFGWKSTIAKPDLLYQTDAISIGKGVSIRKGARLETIGSWNGKEPKMVIGDGCSIHLYFHCGAAQSVTIGRNVLIASRVYISDHDHEFDNPELPPIKAGLIVSPVVIEDEVWVGEGAVILKGVTVGKRAVIGSNAVVTKDVPPFSVAGGVPAKILRRIKVFGDDA